MQTDLSVAFVGVGGVIVGAAIPLFGRWQDNKEKYKQMAFEKRLQVHQQAYGLCDKLMQTSFTKISTEDVVEKVFNWYSENCLYLDNNSRHALWKLTRAIQEYTVKHGPYQPDIITREQFDDHVKLRELQVETQNIIARGIGVKYIPEIKDLTPSTKPPV